MNIGYGEPRDEYTLKIPIGIHIELFTVVNVGLYGRVLKQTAGNAGNRNGGSRRRPSVKRVGPPRHRIQQPSNRRRCKLAPLNPDAFPIAVETSWLPADRFPGLTRQIRTHASLHAILGEVYDTSLRTGEEWIETAPATPREAGPLGVDVGTPMLIVSRQNFDSAGTPVELGRSWFRSDRITLVTHLASRRR